MTIKPLADRVLVLPAQLVMRFSMASTLVLSLRMMERHI